MKWIRSYFITVRRYVPQTSYAFLQDSDLLGELGGLSSKHSWVTFSNL